MSDADSFRDGLAAETLLLRVCAMCGRAAYPPMPGCPSCGHDEGETVVSKGDGTLYTWTVCHVAFDPSFADDVPYTVGLVEVSEGARVLARISGDPDALVADMPVTARFESRTDGPTLLTFVAREADQ